MLSWLPGQSYTRQYYLFILSLIVSEPQSWVSSVWCLVCITRKRRKAPFLTMLFHFCMLYWTPIKHKQNKNKQKKNRKERKQKQTDKNKNRKGLGTRSVKYWYSYFHALCYCYSSRWQTARLPSSLIPKLSHHYRRQVIKIGVWLPGNETGFCLSLGCCWHTRAGHVQLVYIHLVLCCSSEQTRRVTAVLWLHQRWLLLP